SSTPAAQGLRFPALKLCLRHDRQRAHQGAPNLAHEGIPLMVRYSATLDNPRNNGFVSAFKAIRDGEEPDQYAQAGYDSLYLLAKAIKRANSTNPAEVREAFAKSKYVSVTGSPIRFDERSQATPKLYVAVIKDGRRVIVEDVCRHHVSCSQ